MPTDLSTYNPRLRSPFDSRLRNKSQASICDETSTSFNSGVLFPEVRLVNMAVI